MSDEELERLARAATPGPWEYNGHRIQAVATVPVDWADEPQNPSVIWDPFCFERPDVDRPYVVAANPATVLSLLERLKATERPSHPTAAHAQRVVTALEEMLAPLSDGTVGTRDVVGRVAALLERLKKAENFAEHFAVTAEAAVRHAEFDGKGMQVPFHDDFAGVKGHPSLVRNLKWWAREAREVLKKP